MANDSYDCRRWILGLEYFRKQVRNSAFSSMTSRSANDSYRTQQHAIASARSQSNSGSGVASELANAIGGSDTSSN
jgi:hypothetical protein